MDHQTPLKLQTEQSSPNLFADGKQHIYTTRNTVGMASFHLQLDNECYVNGENAPWRTDDGKKFPAKKLFHNAYFNLEERLFTGTLLWDDSTALGSTRWDYIMEFSKDFENIIGG